MVRLAPDAILGARVGVLAVSRYVDGHYARKVVTLSPSSLRRGTLDRGYSSVRAFTVLRDLDVSRTLLQQPIGPRWMDTRNAVSPKAMGPAT